jgi:23S rRNA pseudouridine1911/1915/1917 synthase
VTRRIEIAIEKAGERLDVAVARAAGITRSQAARLIDGGAVSVGGVVRPRSHRVEAGERLEVDLPDAPLPPGPEDIDVPVVYEDGWLLVVAKPAGLVVHPAPGHTSGTLVNALLARAGRLPGEAGRPGIVHRLDAGTSGLMIVATDDEAYTALQRMMAAHEIDRTYLTLVEGSPSASGEIDAPLGRSPRHRKKIAVVAGGREARTSYRRVEAFREAALLEVTPQTGRTHQIRVHLSAAGHPVVGDTVYGRDRKLAARLGLARPFLHSARLGFDHPITGDRVALEEPLPPDLEEALARLRDAASTSR